LINTTQQHPPDVVQAFGVRRVYRLGENRVEALRGVDLTVAGGEVLAIVGPSGSGKTTLLNCLSGLDQVDDGRIVVCGQEIAGLSQAALTRFRARHLGFVFQQYNLLPVLTAVENVEFTLMLGGTPARAARLRAMQELDAVGMAHRAWHRPGQLSGGEQQRVAVARALVTRPSIVWADEPTGALDTETESEIVELMLALNKDGGTTFVWVTHAPEIAARAHRVIRMRDGAIEATAPPAPLVAAEPDRSLGQAAPSPAGER
jgi:putative ABC transport system ATP-binding protein